MKKTKRHNKTRSYFSIVFPILIIIGILFAYSSFYQKSWSYNWNGISQQVKDSVKIAENGGISSGIVGYDGKKPKQFYRRYWIMKNATETELLKLTEYPNATIKAIAYEGLLRKREFEDKSKIVLKSIKETKYPINYQMGCTGKRMSITEYLIDFVLYLDNQGPPIPEGSYNRFSLTDKEVEKIMSEYINISSL